MAWGHLTPKKRWNWQNFSCAEIFFVYIRFELGEIFKAAAVSLTGAISSENLGIEIELHI